jgi:hypothetical protein
MTAEADIRPAVSVTTWSVVSVAAWVVIPRCFWILETRTSSYRRLSISLSSSLVGLGRCDRVSRRAQRDRGSQTRARLSGVGYAKARRCGRQAICKDAADVAGRQICKGEPCRRRGVERQDWRWMLHGAAAPRRQGGVLFEIRDRAYKCKTDQYCTDSSVARVLSFPSPGDTDRCGDDQRTRLSTRFDDGLDAVPDYVWRASMARACE